MTTIFDGYDEEYRALTSDISKKISEIATYEDQKGALYGNYSFSLAGKGGKEPGKANPRVVWVWCRQEEGEHRPCRGPHHTGAAAGEADGESSAVREF